MKLGLNLFFTAGVSLETWDGAGMLGREVALYKRLEELGVRVRFISHGGPADLKHRRSIAGIRLVCNRYRLPGRVYRSLITSFYPMLWRGAQVIKSNQVQGAQLALAAARRFGIPFIARCGYLLSDFMEQSHGAGSHEAAGARELEREVFTGADRVVVTTQAMLDTVVGRYSVSPGKVSVIPNYVNTELFRPAPAGGAAERRVCFIGRLAEQKNPFALMDAVDGLGVELVLVGSGPLEGALRGAASSRAVNVRFLGNLPNSELPGVLNSSALYVLPSFYEGHPKTLIEAMSCGVPVIGADSPGIRGLISHGETGLLCGTTPAEIRSAITEALGDPGLRERVGRRAREYAVENFSLDRVAGMEAKLLMEVAL